MALQDNLVAYYKLDGNSNDSVGSNNGTDTNITYGTSYGKIGEGALLAENSRALIPSQSVFNLQQSFSLFAWVKLSSYGKGTSYFGGIITKDNLTTNNRCFNFGVRGPADGGNTGKLRFTYNVPSDTSVLSTSTVPLNEWALVGIVSNQTTYTFYINGTAAGSASVNITPTYGGTASLSLGYAENTTYVEGMRGSLDEVGIWNRALTSTEVGELYNSGNGLQYPFVTSIIYTLTCAYTSFALTGYSILLKRIIKGLLSYGSFALTGIASLFKKITKLSVTNGSFSFTGFDLLVHRLIHLVLAVGNFALTGIDVIIIKGKAIFMSAGTFVVTGSELNFHRLIHIVASVGSYTLTGINALLHRVSRGLFSFGYFVVTGQDSLFHRVTKLSMAFGSFVYTGISSVFHKRINILLSAGYYTLSGFSLLFHRGYTVILSAGNFVLTGFKAFFSGIGSWLWGIQDKDDGSGWTKQDKN